MGVYGYCVVPAGHRPPDAVRGIGGAPVSGSDLGELCVWVSDIDQPEPELAAIQAHNTVVEAAVTATVTPVPLRFGQWAASTDAFTEAVLGRAEWYGDRLRLFAGALEFGLRTVDFRRPRPARVVQAAPATSGREYMQALLERAAATRTEREAAAGVRAAITQELGALARAEQLEAGRSSHAIVEAAHLVERANFDAYRSAAVGLRERFPDLRFLVSGPWAPYSFAA